MYLSSLNKLSELETRIAQLEAQNVDLNQRVITLDGHLTSVSGYVREQARRIAALERENSNMAEKYAMIIHRLEYVEQQVGDEDARQLVIELTEKAIQRRADRTHLAGGNNE